MKSYKSMITTECDWNTCDRSPPQGRFDTTPKTELDLGWELACAPIYDPTKNHWVWFLVKEVPEGKWISGSYNDCYPDPPGYRR